MHFRQIPYTVNGFKKSAIFPLDRGMLSEKDVFYLSVTVHSTDETPEISETDRPLVSEKGNMISPEKVQPFHREKQE